MSFGLLNFIWIPITILGIALPLMLVVRLMKGSAQRKRILATGTPAQATIMRIWETGTRVNNQPLVGFEVQVHPHGGHPYMAQTQMIISALQIPSIAPGAVVHCKFDPADPTKVALMV
jgi:hypothetical protein